MRRQRRPVHHVCPSPPEVAKRRIISQTAAGASRLCALLADPCLAAYAFTPSVQTANAIADALKSGIVGVNSLAISHPETPFGGIEGLQTYFETKLVTMA
jgi:hypothetical protein